MDVVPSGLNVQQQFGYLEYPVYVVVDDIINDNTLYVGNPFLDLSVKSNYGYVGGVYVMKRSANCTWVKSNVIYLPGMPNLMRFGWSIDTNAKGDTLVVSSIEANMGDGSRQGTVHILQ